MLQHALYVLLGFADHLGCLLMGPPPAHHRGRSADARAVEAAAAAEAIPPSWYRSGWALLLVIACVPLLGLVLSYAIPPTATALHWVSSDSLPFLAIATLGTCLFVLARFGWRLVANCHRNGKAIAEGSRVPAWRRRAQ